MPIYEYRCDDCGHELEVIQKMSDDPLTDCPACEGTGLRKLVSAGAFQLKGSGWYATDFKDSGRKKPEAKSESKPESKPEAKSGSGSGGTGTTPAAAAG